MFNGIFLYILIAAPTSMFCTSPSDPCSCTGGTYQSIESLCSYLKADVVTQAKLYKTGLSGKPNIPSKYLLPGNGTSNYTINLPMLQKEYQTYFEQFDSDTLNQFILGSGLIILIAFSMILAHELMHRGGCKASLDNDSQKPSSTKLTLVKATKTLSSIEHHLNKVVCLSLYEKISLSHVIRSCEKVIKASERNEETHILDSSVSSHRIIKTK